tara:strand:- start:400 stop:750 length:351 start_codon:yes stop_codon:yes gene_type:complete
MSSSVDDIILSQVSYLYKRKKMSHHRIWWLSGMTLTYIFGAPYLHQNNNCPTWVINIDNQSILITPMRNRPDFYTQSNWLICSTDELTLCKFRNLILARKEFVSFKSLRSRDIKKK